MPWIRTVALDEATGKIGSIYRSALERAGKVFNIVRISSIDAEATRASMALYRATTVTPNSPLSRWFRELIAVQVSRLNECFY